MRSVSRFESNLLSLLRCLFGQVPVEQGLAVLAKPAPRPRCLSADAVALVEDTLAKGMVGWLGRLGMPRERHLRAGAVADGRLWQRTPPEELGLAFSPLSLEFLLQWLSNDWKTIATKIDDATVGDRLLFCLAHDRFRDLDVGRLLAEKWPPLHRDGLCRLMFLDELRDTDQRQSTIQWHVWTSGVGACVLEAMQEALAERWTLLERAKETRSEVQAMQSLGANQQRVLGEYLEALAVAERRDLARCFLMAGQQLLREAPTARRWIGKLQLQGQRLADRVQLYRAALALLVQFERLQQWERDCRGVGYFDEGYAASQLWKADWERFQASASCERAAAILHEVAPLRA